MHHTVEMSVPSAATDETLRALEELEGVLSLYVERGVGVKPEGDVITVHALDRAVDAVLATAAEAERHGPIVVVTGGVNSVIATGARGAIDDDADESPWEEFERTLRHHGRLSGNYLLLAVGGGLAFLVLRALGLASPRTIASSEGVHLVIDPTAVDWLVAAGGAVAGLLIITSFREAVLAGALIALALVPAGGVLGMGVAALDGELALQGLQRLGQDVALVVVLGGLVILGKDRLIHGGRRPLA